MARHARLRSIRQILLASALAVLSSAQQCYIAPGVAGPSNLVSCTGATGGTCCLQGDYCLSGNACYNQATGNTYQYGCADSTYSSSTCPYKCGWDVSKSPWIGLGYCGEVGNTWTCFAADSCGCTWPSPATSLAKLPYRSCADMGDNARVGLYAPGNLGGYALLPATSGQPISSIGPLLDYGSQPTRVIKVFSTSSTSTSTSTSSSSTSSTRPSSSTTSSTSSSSSRTSSATTGLVSISSPTSSSSSSPSSSSAPDPASAADSGSTLSTGAKAGIGAGVGGIALVATAVIAALLIARKRRGLRDDSDPAGQHMPEKGTHSWISTASERRY